MTATSELGEMLDWTPARAPDRTTLRGEVVRLEPLDPSRHGPALYTASHGPETDPRLWDYLPDGPFEDQDAFTAWLKRAARSSDPLFFSVVDQQSGSAQGMVSYLRINLGHAVIEIGYIWFGPALRQTRGATEAIFILARHAFDDLGNRRLEWKCDALNQRSRRAAERLGFTFEGVFRKHMVVKERNRDTAWYAMLDEDWPLAKAAFERWLAPDNFDGAGRQRVSLGEIRNAIACADQQ